jgi:hypothetical protein
MPGLDFLGWIASLPSGVRNDENHERHFSMEVGTLAKFGKVDIGFLAQSSFCSSRSYYWNWSRHIRWCRFELKAT